MTTTTKTRNKIDFQAIIDSAPKKPEPMSLEECLREAGGFPFKAKVIVPNDDPASWPLGSVVTCLRSIIAGEVRSTEDAFLTKEKMVQTIAGKKRETIGAQSKYKRWQLLGSI